MLKVKHDESSSSAELLDHRWNHHRPQADRIARNHQECNLKGQTNADKAVVEAWMSDPRRVLTADQVKHEYSGVRISTPQMPAIQKVIFANFMSSSCRQQLCGVVVIHMLQNVVGQAEAV
jgi:hypothetical protein